MSDPEDQPGDDRDVERQREVDPDAPGLGGFGEGDEDAPEPNEPG